MLFQLVNFYVQSFSKVLWTLAIFHEKSTYTVDVSIKSIFSPPPPPQSMLASQPQHPNA